MIEFPKLKVKNSKTEKKGTINPSENNNIFPEKHNQDESGKSSLESGIESVLSEYKRLSPEGIQKFQEISYDYGRTRELLISIIEGKNSEAENSLGKSGAVVSKIRNSYNEFKKNFPNITGNIIEIANLTDEEENIFQYVLKDKLSLYLLKAENQKSGYNYYGEKPEKQEKSNLTSSIHPYYHEVNHTDDLKYNLQDINGLKDYIKQEIILNTKPRQDMTKDECEKSVTEKLYKLSQENNKQKLYERVFESMYEKLRGAYYQADSRYENDISEYTEKKGVLLKRVQDEKGWHYRVPQTATSRIKTVNRISLNVVPSKKLIDILDKISFDFGVYYKTPETNFGWQKRHDPITMYINESLSEKQVEILKDMIKTGTEEFVRSNDGIGIVGEKFADGLEFGEDKRLENLKILEQESKEIDFDLYCAIIEYFSGYDFSTHKRTHRATGSAGQIACVKRVIDNIKRNK